MQSSGRPGPISWAPSQYWDGIDGQWSSFSLRAGTPGQNVRVLPSTSASATWLVVPEGCKDPAAPANCTDGRGGLFDLSQSSTWKEQGLFELTPSFNKLGRNETGLYGFDTLSLGLSNASSGPILAEQSIAGIRTSHYYTGFLGLQQQPLNLSDFDHPRPTVLSSLRAKNLIPSLSWSYTAGAQYQSKGSFGSLTFGGSDISRYKPTNISFALAPDVSRDLVVGIQAITTTYGNGSVSSLLPSPTLAFIDSTLPYIYLPEEACKTFEAQLGLTYDPKRNLYLVSDATHRNLLDSKPQFTFRLGNDVQSKPTIDITLPYASFDLTIQPPMLPNTTSYFPLRRGNDSQITLGRAFLQEAYLITDYDKQNFTIAQAVFNDTAKPNIVPIPWNATIGPAASHHLSRRGVIGVSVGSGILFLLLLIVGAFLFLRWRLFRAMSASAKPSNISRPMGDVKVFPIAGIHEMGRQSLQELDDTDLPKKLELLDYQSPTGSGKLINELPERDAPSWHKFLPSSPQRSKPPISHELLDETTPTGSGKYINELPDKLALTWHKFFPPSTRQSKPPINNSRPSSSSHTPSYREMPAPSQRSSTYSTASSTPAQAQSPPSGKSPHSPFSNSAARSSTAASAGATSARSTQAASYSSPATTVSTPHLSLNLNKALPRIPLPELQVNARRVTPRHLSPTSIPESREVSPVERSPSRSPSFADGSSVLLVPRLSQGSTYAQVFDVEEYTGGR